jgi:hypothetical protein
MVNPDLFESYLNLTFPKDLSLVGSVKFPTGNKTIDLKNLTNYYIVKQRVEDFSEDRPLMKLYAENPLHFIRSEILKKDMSLREELDSRLLSLENSVNDYSGAHPRKISEIYSNLEFLSLAYNYIGSNVDFESAKEIIKSKVHSKVNSNKKVSKIKHRFNYSTLLHSALLVGGLYLGSTLFPQEKIIHTTINKKIYENTFLPLEKRVNQFVFDRNLLLKYESDLVQELVHENNTLRGD